MAQVIKYLYKLYRLINYDLADPRSKDYFLIDSPLTVVGGLVAYNFFVFKWGPELMKDRKPFKIDKYIQVYNILQVIMCLWILAQGIIECYGPTGIYSWRCEPVDTSESPVALKAIRYFWYYFMIKIFDLLDTIFFVLRKKYSQITFLHVYHHTGMVMLSWGATKYLPGGHASFIGTINCLVHAFMYGYYFVTSYYPSIKSNLWWKKYITQLQMLQFLAIIIHFGQVLFQSDCGYPKWAVTLFLPHNIIIIILFAKFYKDAYLTPKKDQVKTS